MKNKTIIKENKTKKFIGDDSGLIVTLTQYYQDGLEDEPFSLDIENQGGEIHLNSLELWDLLDIIQNKINIKPNTKNNKTESKLRKLIQTEIKNILNEKKIILENEMTYEELYKLCSNILKEWPRSTDAGSALWSYMVGNIETENDKINTQVPIKRFKSLIGILDEYDLWDDLKENDKKLLLNIETQLKSESTTKIKKIIKEEIRKVLKSKRKNN